MWRWMIPLLALVAAGSAAATAFGQTSPRADMRDVVAAVSLTAADVPRGLALDERRSGPRTSADGWPSYQATFVASGPGDQPIMAVVNVVEQESDAAAGLDRITERFGSGMGSNRTELTPPELGEGSRAFTAVTQAMGGAMSASTAFVGVRRQNVVAGVAVASFGNTPQVDVALRLARDLDRRLSSALGAGS